MNCEKNKPVAFVIWAGEAFGGMERRYVRLANHLAQENQSGEVLLLARGVAKPSIKKLLADNPAVKILTYGSGSSKKLGVLGALFDVAALGFSIFRLRKYHIHVCLNPGYVTSFVGILLVFKRRKSASMVDLTFGFRMHRIKRAHAILATKLFARIDCLSPETKRILEEATDKTDDTRNKVAPCSFTDFSQIEISKHRDIDILMLARFVEYKGYDLIEKIKDDIKFRNVHLCGFGPRPMSFEGFAVYETNRPLSILGRTKIFLSLQATNNYPSQSVLEAMASECAIIATDVGETRQFLDDDCSILIPSDAIALREAITKLMSDDDLRHRLGQMAKQRVLNEHTVERYAQYFKDEILDLYHPYHHRS